MTTVHTFTALGQYLAADVNSGAVRARIQVLPLMAAIILAVGAIVVGVLGAVAEPPDVTGTKMPSVGMAFAFYVNAKVYVSLAFAVISVLFAALFVPKAKRDATA